MGPRDGRVSLDYPEEGNIVNDRLYLLVSQILMTLAHLFEEILNLFLGETLTRLYPQKF